MNADEKAAVDEYRSSLEDLTFNSKPLINVLTMLAEENAKYAQNIVELISQHIKKSSPPGKMPVLYLLDSILKNVGEAYRQMIARHIVGIFTNVFQNGDEKIRLSLFKLRSTWSPCFEAGLLHQLDVKVKDLDPNWPIASASSSSGRTTAGAVSSAVKNSPRGTGTDSAEVLRQKLLQDKVDKATKLREQKLLEEKKKVEQLLASQERRKNQQRAEEERLKKELLLREEQHDRERLIHEQQREIEKLRMAKEELLQANLAQNAAMTTGEKRQADGRIPHKQYVVPGDSEDSHRMLPLRRNDMSLGVGQPTSRVQQRVNARGAYGQGGRGAAHRAPYRRRDAFPSRPLTADAHAGHVPGKRLHSNSEDEADRPKHMRHSDYQTPGRRFDRHSVQHHATRDQRRPSNRRLSMQERRQMIPPDREMPRQMRMDQHKELMIQLERRLSSGKLTPREHAELVSQLEMLYKIQQRQKSTSKSEHWREAYDSKRNRDNDFASAQNHKDEGSHPAAKEELWKHRPDEGRFSPRLPDSDAYDDGNSEQLHSTQAALQQHDAINEQIDRQGHSRQGDDDRRGERRWNDYGGDVAVAEYNHRSATGNQYTESRIPSDTSAQGDYYHREGLFEQHPQGLPNTNSDDHDVRSDNADTAAPCDHASASNPGQHIEHHNDAKNEPAEPADSGQPPPSNNDSSFVGVADLFHRLLQSGIVTLPSEDGGAAESQSSAPSDEQQHPAGEQCGTREEDEWEERSALPEIEWSMEHLKKYYPGTIDRLCRGVQCSSCGLRFPEQQKSEYGEHLDWHFRINRRDTDSRRGSSRMWLLEADDWLGSNENTALDERGASVAFFESELLAKTAVGGVDEPSSCAVDLDTDDDDICDICFEPFEQYWDESLEEWRYREAVRIEGRTLHDQCYKDVQLDMDDRIEDEASEESTVLVKREPADGSEQGIGFVTALNIGDTSSNVVKHERAILDVGIHDEMKGARATPLSGEMSIADGC